MRRLSFILETIVDTRSIPLLTRKIHCGVDYYVVSPLKLKIMKNGVHSDEFDSDLFQLWGAFPDKCPPLEEFYQLLGDYESGMPRIRFQVDRLGPATGIIRFLYSQNEKKALLIVPFLETEKDYIFLRMHVIDLPGVMAA